MEVKYTDTFEYLILRLQDYWLYHGCIIMQPFDMEVGAGTSHPMTFFLAINSGDCALMYVQPSRRPVDGRYGKNINRLQHYFQFQVIIKPSPDNIQELYINSLRTIGIDFTVHDLRFVEDDWENLTLGAWGIGWEVWLDGIEITQFTYFQQMGGLDCQPITGEITYGLERLAMILQGVDSVYDIVWAKRSDNVVLYGDLFYYNELEQSTYNFEYTDIKFLFICFDHYEKEAKKLLSLDVPLIFPAYECILKVIHNFNLLDSRKIISVTERKNYILRISKLTKIVAEKYRALISYRTSFVYNSSNYKIREIY